MTSVNSCLPHATRCGVSLAVSFEMYGYPILGYTDGVLLVCTCYDSDTVYRAGVLGRVAMLTACKLAENER
jgi:hypothetical protein